MRARARVRRLEVLLVVAVGKRGRRLGDDEGDDDAEEEGEGSSVVVVVVVEPGLGLGWMVKAFVVVVVLVLLRGGEWEVKTFGERQGRVKGRWARWRTVRMMPLKSRPVAQANMSALRCTVGVPPLPR